MPDPTTPPATAERPIEPLVYRPVSGLAIAGLALAALFAVLLLVSVVVTFVRQEPFYLPGWVLVLAVAGGVLSALALRQIRASEGTRAGAGLARVGLWVAAIAGLGSFTFSFFTGLAIQQQANRFLMEKGPDAGFFPLLQQGEVNQAFLLTMPPDKRQANPHDEKLMDRLYDMPADKKSSEGMLSMFRSMHFVQVLQQPYDPPAQIRAMGVRGWEYGGKGYKVTRTYRISTPEGEFDLPVMVQSFDSEVEGEGRKWMVVRDPSMILEPVRLTERGRKLSDLRDNAIAFINVSMQKLAIGQPFELYLDTLPPAQRAAWRNAGLALLFGVGASAGGSSLCAPGFVTVPGSIATFAFSPDPQRLGENRLLVFDRLRVRGNPELGERIRRAGAYLAAKGPVFIKEPGKVGERDRFGRWQIKDGRLEMSFVVGFGLNLPDARFPPGAVVICRAVVSTEAGADASNRADPGRLWRLERLEFDRALPMEPRPGPPG